MGRWIPGAGAPLSLPLLVAEATSNKDPNAPAVADEWEITIGGLPDPGDILHITIGVDDYQYEVQVADTVPIMATNLAAAVVDPDYTAMAVGAVVTVTANVAGTPTRVADASIDPSLGTGTITPVNTVPGDDAGIPFGAGLSLAGSIATTASLECELLAGVSYDVAVWTRDQSNVWTEVLATQTVVADTSLAVPLSGMRAYVFLNNLIGGAVVTTTLTTSN